MQGQLVISSCVGTGFVSYVDLLLIAFVWLGLVFES